MAFKGYLKEAEEQKLNAISDFVFDALFFQKQIHVWHLQTGSYAQHMALGDFYTNIEDKIDSIAEAITGMSRKLVTPSKTFAFNNGQSNLATFVSALEAFKGRATALFESTGDLAGINNTFAEVVALCDSTIYKLKNLQ